MRNVLESDMDRQMDAESKKAKQIKENVRPAFGVDYSVR